MSQVASLVEPKCAARGHFRRSPCGRYEPIRAGGGSGRPLDSVPPLSAFESSDCPHPSADILCLGAALRVRYDDAGCGGKARYGGTETVFKTVAFVRSAILPRGGYRRICPISRCGLGWLLRSGPDQFVSLWPGGTGSALRSAATSSETLTPPRCRYPTITLRRHRAPDPRRPKNLRTHRLPRLSISTKSGTAEISRGRSVLASLTRVRSRASVRWNTLPDETEPSSILIDQVAA